MDLQTAWRDSQKNVFRRRKRIYQVYLPAFFDSNGDGIGDIPGIIARLDYIQKLNPDAIWVTPWFEAPEGAEGDGGYAPSCYRSIDKRFGTMTDIGQLVAEAKKRGMHIYMDLPLAHTASRHEWFQKSRAARMRGDLEDPYAHFYVWHPGPRDEFGEPLKAEGHFIPPNNWQSSFGGKAWAYDHEVGMWYMHNFSRCQPTLNLNDIRTQQAIFAEAAFWAEKGLDLRLDALSYLNHDPEFRNNVPLKPDPGYYKDFDMLGSMNPAMTAQLLKNFRCYLDERGLSGTRLLGEVLNAQRQTLEESYTLSAYPDGRKAGLNGMEAAALFADPGNGGTGCYTGLTLNGQGFPTSERLEDIIKAMLRNFRDPAAHYWSFSNHDRVRIATRWTDNLPEHERESATRLLFRILNTLPGSVCIYQGEEAGFRQAEIYTDIPVEKIRDPALEGRGIKLVRDGARTPMAWTAAAKNGGFTENDEPYLPLKQGHVENAIDRQLRDETSPDFPHSILNTNTEFLAHCDRQMALDGEVSVSTQGSILLFLYKAETQVLLCAHNCSSQYASFRPGDVFDISTCASLGLNPHYDFYIEPYGSKFPGAIEPALVRAPVVQSWRLRAA